MSSMLLDDEYEKRRAKAYQDYDTICKQFSVLLEKLDALGPPKKRTRRSAKKRKTKAEKKPASARRRPAAGPDAGDQGALQRSWPWSSRASSRSSATTSTGRRRPEAAQARQLGHRHRRLQRGTSSESRATLPCPALAQ
ncbi:uncharacterized protein LOC120655716 [Panicum virgatum]|uniref:Uncharacterized protein n=1 Tax=Panicum virgatum TaxID=38727 RepID=A0A8T0XQD8_PANVG|nr:uncharacterized protein LOC120655716 [Panicum virgatum]KAG2660336.1 hypothetical protein PVAP13_1KG388000 [Panicum virgatum]